MSDNNLPAKLVKKSLGMPAASGCCGSVAGASACCTSAAQPAATDCCVKAPSEEMPAAQRGEAAGCCGTAAAQATGSACCSA